MAIVLPKSENWNGEIEKIMELPLIFVGVATNIYLLIRSISKELENFIYTGDTEAAELSVFSKEEELAMLSRWRKLKFKAVKRSQRIEYMDRCVTINYLQAVNPKTGVKISLIPWFMLPGRPFPVFTYIYAIWHYYSAGEKSLKKAAAAAGKLFGIKGFNKSTVSRSIKALRNIIDLAGIDMPLSVGEPELPVDGPELLVDDPKLSAVEKLQSHIPQILNGIITVEAMKDQYGEMVKHLPEPINGSGSVQRALSAITGEYSRVIEGSKPVRRGKGDGRKRPARPYNKGRKREQSPYTFANSTQIKETRIAFIKTCRCLVMNSAATYHIFLG